MIEPRYCKMCGVKFDAEKPIAHGLGSNYFYCSFACAARRRDEIEDEHRDEH